MKKTILCLIILLQFQSYAQDNPKWSLGLKYAIDNLSLSDGRDGIDYLITNGNINRYAIKFVKNNFQPWANYGLFDKQKNNVAIGYFIHQ